MKPRHIALFFPALSFGGVESVMLELAKGLVERGLRVDVVVASAEGEYRNRVPATVRLFDLGCKHVSFGLSKLVLYLRRERPDALLSAADHANTIALWARKLSRVKIPVVITQHSVFSEATKFAYGWRGRLAMFLAAKTYPLADGYIAVSEAVACDLSTTLRIAPQKVKAIYNPVVTAQLWKQAAERVDHPWLTGEQKHPVVLAVGRLLSQKGFKTLIEAFALARKHTDARLIILGEGEARGELESQVAQLELQEFVSLPGYTENPVAYMARAAVFVVPSLWESFSIVLVQAMSTGTPIVATDCHGPREILQDGKYGVLVPVADSAAMAEAIVAQARQWRRAVDREALKRFDSEAIVEAYLQFVEEVAITPRPSERE